MFWTALGEVLTPASGAAMSPTMIVAAVILASKKDGATRAFLFAAGTFFSLLGMSLLVYWIADLLDVGVRSRPSMIGTAIRLCLGVFFCWMSYKTFRDRPRNGEPVKLPKWLVTIDDRSSLGVVLLGISLGTMNVKNLPLAVTAGTSVAQVDTTSTVALIVMLIFATIGTLGVLVPGLLVLIAPRRAPRRLGWLRDQYIEHNTAIMIVLYGMLGSSIISKSLGPLFG